MNDSMSSELGPKPIGEVSLNAIEASVNRTVSDRFKGLGEKARSVIRMATQRTVLTVGALALLISSGCSNTEQINTPIPAEPTPISTPIFTPTAEAVKTPEKQALTDVEYVSNLLGTYLNLDADPRLKRLEDVNLLSTEVVKTFRDSYDHEQVLPLGEFDLKLSPDQHIVYTIRSANLIINSFMRGGKMFFEMGFPMDEEGRIVPFGDPRLGENQPLPTKEKLDQLIASDIENFTKLLKHKPNPDAWAIDPMGSDVLRIMKANVNSPEGNVQYSVGGTGERPRDVSVSVRD